MIYAFIISGCGATAEVNEMKTYYSTDSLFSVEVPDNFKTYSSPLPNMMGFSDEEQLGTIMITKEEMIDNSLFQDYVAIQVSKMNPDLTKELVESTDTLVFYRFSKGLEETNKFFMRKRGSTNDFLIMVSGPNLKRETAVLIASTVTEHNEHNYTKQTAEENLSNYNKYNKAGFAITNNYLLNINREFAKLYRQNGAKLLPNIELLGTYTFAQNSETNDPDVINIITINSFKLKENKENTKYFSTDSLSNYAENILSLYANNLEFSKIDYHSIEWEEAEGIEFNYIQPFGEVDVPTQALYCYKDERFYLIELASLNDTEKKFRLLLKSIKLLPDNENVDNK